MMKKKINKIIPQFVDVLPDNALMKRGVLYISMKYAISAHLCPCGCGNLVVTPLSPSCWQLAFDGETITLSPSILCDDFVCNSHYFIINNRIVWCGRKYKNGDVNGLCDYFKNVYKKRRCKQI